MAFSSLGAYHSEKLLNLFVFLLEMNLQKKFPTGKVFFVRKYSFKFEKQHKDD